MLIRIAAAALATFMSIATARAAPRFIDPWPDARQARGVQVEDVHFTSSDAFAPEDLGHAPARDVRAMLFLPADAKPAHPVPAVVLLHGSAGNAVERGERYGEPLAAMGVAVLVIETYASRPDLGSSYLTRVLNITETMFVADAYAGLRYLSVHPEIDARHTALIGFSYGGMATTYALYAQMADKVAPPGLRFVGHVAYYAPCIARFRDSRTTGAPLLMLYGQDDQLIDPKRCDQVADDLRGGGSVVQIISYPGAVHQWDGEMPRGVIGRHLAGCSFTVNRDGAVSDANTGLPMSGPFLRKVILALCTGGRPYPIGRDQSVVNRSNHELGVFLSRVFALPPTG